MIKAALKRAMVLFPMKGPDKTLRDGIIFSVSVPARLRLLDGKGRSRGETIKCGTLGKWEPWGFLSQNKSLRRPIQARLFQKACGEAEGQGQGAR